MKTKLVLHQIFTLMAIMLLEPFVLEGTSTCNTEENRRKADEYLSSIPVDLTGYTINYNVSGLDARCSNG